MSFINENFLLETNYAEALYHDFAKGMPIIDYHNHLSPEQIAVDHQFGNIAEAWLDSDHYKWRAMRTLGVEEHYVTGSAMDREKFQKWAETVPLMIRNPLYHWTHLELKRYFGIDALLSKDNANEIYSVAQTQLGQKSHSTRGLLKKMNVEIVCTTDDPIDTLEHHQMTSGNGISPIMLPTFRPDMAYALEDQEIFFQYVQRIGEVSGVEVSSYSDLLEALGRRIAFFDENGCKVSDHGLERFYFFKIGQYDIEAIFRKAVSGKPLDSVEIAYFKFETLIHLCRKYHDHGWVQQFHLGALRSVNTRKLKELGPNTGFDSIGDFQHASSMARFLDHLDRTDQLSKTILYNLNPSDNEVFATMAGNFNDGSVKGKVQFGTGWWHLDQLDGMERQINALSNMGMLSCFVGMLTDSRSFLSFPRHEYFRRLLCNILGNDIQKGLLPKDLSHLGKIVQDICYNNAKTYFNF